MKVFEHFTNQREQKKARLLQPCHIMASHRIKIAPISDRIIKYLVIFFWFELLLIGVDWKHMECIPLVSTQMMADEDATERNVEKKKKSVKKVGRPVVRMCSMLFTLDRPLTKRFFFCRNKTDLNTKWEYDSRTMNARNGKCEDMTCQPKKGIPEKRDTLKIYRLFNSQYGRNNKCCRYCVTVAEEQCAFLSIW